MVRFHKFTLFQHMPLLFLRVEEKKQSISVFVRILLTRVIKMFMYTQRLLIFPNRNLIFVNLSNPSFIQI